MSWTKTTKYNKKKTK